MQGVISEKPSLRVSSIKKINDQESAEVADSSEAAEISSDEEGMGRMKLVDNK